MTVTQDSDALGVLFSDVLSALEKAYAQAEVGPDGFKVFIDQVLDTLADAAAELQRRVSVRILVFIQTEQNRTRYDITAWAEAWGETGFALVD